MPFADFWQTIGNPHEFPSPYSETSARPPGVGSPAFSAQPLDLQPEPLMDMGLSVICLLARLGMPRIQFLSVGSRLCSTLLSDTLSRDRCPCASLRLHLHQVGEGTFTPKLVNMPSTQRRRLRRAGRSLSFAITSANSHAVTETALLDYALAAGPRLLFHPEWRDHFEKPARVGS